MTPPTARGRPWLAVGGGAVAGAAVTVAALLGLGWAPPDDSGGGSIAALPDTAGGLRTETAVVTDLRGEPLEGRADMLEETAELLSASRGGAATATQAYADDNLDQRYTVWAVADGSSALWSPDESEAAAEVMMLETPMEWVERDGDVECLVQPVTLVRRDSGGEVEVRVDRCQLVREGTTLLLVASGPEATVSRAAAVLRDVATAVEQG